MKDVEEMLAKRAAKKERERERERRRHKKDGVVQKQEFADDDGESWTIIFTIAFGVIVALSEALDIDVLIGILLMPFISAMKYLAAKFDNENLDPHTWTTKFGEAYNDLCRNHPAAFVQADFGLFVLFVILILFEADISKWWRERSLRAEGYDELTEEHEGPTDEGLEKLFHELDEDHGGSISTSEMDHAVKKLFGDDVDHVIVEEIMKAADDSGDGELDLEEFKLVMRAGAEKLGGLSKVSLLASLLVSSPPQPLCVYLSLSPTVTLCDR